MYKLEDDGERGWSLSFKSLCAVNFSLSCRPIYNVHFVHPSSFMPSSSARLPSDIRDVYLLGASGSAHCSLRHDSIGIGHMVQKYPIQPNNWDYRRMPNNPIPVSFEPYRRMTYDSSTALHASHGKNAKGQNQQHVKCEKMRRIFCGWHRVLVIYWLVLFSLHNGWVHVSIRKR